MKPGDLVRVPLKKYEFLYTTRAGDGKDTHAGEVKGDDLCLVLEVVMHKGDATVDPEVKVLGPGGVVGWSYSERFVVV